MIRYFAGHPTVGNLLMLAMLSAGLFAVPGLQRETFPALPLDEVEIRINYPAATAEEIEEAICRRIEDAVDNVNDVEELRCESREGAAVAVVEMRDEGEINRFLNDIKTEVEAIDDFPERVEKSTFRQRGRNDFVAAVAITGPMTTADLKAYAEDLKARLGRLPEISEIKIRGFSDHQIRIEIPTLTLRQFGVSARDIANIVGRQSIDLPAGTLQSSEQDVVVRFADERRSIREFQDLIVVGAKSGAEIRLGDIATISDRFEKEEEKIVFNGKRAAFLEISKTRTDDTLRAIDVLKQFLDDERQTAPPQMTFDVTRDVSTILRDRLSMVLRNGAQGLVLVLITLWLFLGLRISFWVALGLPVSFLGALFVMSVFGFSLDMITLVGLLIATGLLVDDAIVIAENVAIHIARGQTSLQAAVDGTREVAPGVLASFATTVCIFAPLMTLSGDIGNVLKFIPIMLILTLSVSLIEAFLILPSHLRHALDGRSVDDSDRELRLRAVVVDAVDWARERIAGRAVDIAIRWRYACIGIVVFCLLASLSMVAGGVLKFRAFPELDGDIVEARLLLPQGTPLARTEAIVAQLLMALDRVNAELTPKQPSGRSLVRNVSVHFNSNVDAFEAGPHVATVTADLLSAKLRSGRVDDIIGRWRREVGDLPDILSLKFAEFQIGIGGRPLDIHLKGADLDELKSAALELQAWLRSYRGVFDVSDDLRPGKQEARIRLREGALVAGLDATDIALQLRSAFFGNTAGDVQVGAEDYEIDVRLARADRDGLADLDYFTVTTATSAQVPLTSVAMVESGRGFARINRVDGRRTVAVQGDVDPSIANASEVIAETQNQFIPGLRNRYPGLDVVFEGEAKESANTGASARRALLIGVFGVFLLLSFLFRSYLEPLIVMLAIPMSLIGVIWGHLLMGLDMSMPSVVGFVALAGVVVNNAILLVEFIKRNVRNGMGVEEAARQASRQRFRAMFLTSITTIVGLLPLLLERSLQAQVFIPLVISLAFGLLAATILVIVVVPAFYAILHDFGITTIAREEAAAVQAA